MNMNNRITESLYRVSGVSSLNEDIDYNAKKALDNLNYHINDVITDVVYKYCRDNGYYTEDEIASKVDEAIKFTFEYLREDIISTVKELLED